jgi:hypothetical protein
VVKPPGDGDRPISLMLDVRRRAETPERSVVSAQPGEEHDGEKLPETPTL